MTTTLKLPLAKGDNTPTDYSPKMAIHHLFEKQATKTPDSVAVVFGDKYLTYRELNQKANQLAHHLQAQGVGPNIPVGLSITRSLEMVVGLLGILKVGGAYVPLDPTYPDHRLAAMITDSQIPLLLTLETLPKKNAQHLPELVYLDTHWPQIAGKPTSNLNLPTSPEDLLYVIYTSGSTGQPKGVALPHRALSNLIDWQLKNSTMQPGSKTLQFTSLSFDVSCQEIFATFCSGGVLVLITEEERRDIKRLAQIIADEQIERIFLPFIALQQLAQHLVVYDKNSLALKEIITAGEQLQTSQALVNLFEHLPNCTLYNQYGPSESHVVTAFKLPPQPKTWPPLPPIGKPIDNTQIYILDADQQPVSDGASGELHIGGVGVAHGYLHRPELTAEKFILNPFDASAKTHLYKTGDIARYLPDGNIEFLGRRDRQVKIRGFRIELGEIEVTLSQHSGLKEVAIIDYEYAAGDKRLVAYIVPHEGQPVSVNELRDFLSEKLPDYMIPSTFTILDTLPLTPSGKVNRRALPPPNQERPELEETFVPPRNPVEETLAKIWAEVIGLERVGINDNYLELGGDSILSIQISSKANQAGIYLAPNQLLEHQTIAQVAAVAGTAPTVRAEQDLITGPLPLTPIQHWLFEKNLPEPHHWNQAFLLELRQPLDASLLEEALRQLLIHHDALRLRFTADEAGWHQVMASADGPLPFSQVDLSQLAEAEHEAAILSTATKLQASLDLLNGPLIRVALFELGPQRANRLLFIINHQAIEGVSWRILFEHLELLCHQLGQQQAIQLPAKTTSYKHWAKRLTEYAQSGTLQQELPFWLAMQEKQPARLPVDFPQVENNNTEASADTISVSLNAEATQTLLKEVPKAYQTQINDVLLTALAEVLAQWTGISTLLVDLEGHGREAIFEDVDLSRTVGWFTAIFPVLLTLENATGSAERLKSIKEQLRRIPNRGIGYGILRYLSQDADTVNKLQGLPQAEMSFNYLGQFDQMLSPTSPFKLTNQFCGPRHSLRGHRPYVLEIEGEIIEEQLQLRWIYSKNIHRQATIEKLAYGFMDALNTIIAACQMPEAGGYTPSDFPEAELSQEELDDLLTEISGLEE